jgi:hypothetical protein
MQKISDFFVYQSGINFFPFVELSINEKKLNALIDSGCSISILSEKFFIENIGAFEVLKEELITSFLNLDTKVDYTAYSKIKINQSEFSDVYVSVVNFDALHNILSISEKDVENFNFVLGANFLFQNGIVLDFSGKAMFHNV